MNWCWHNTDQVQVSSRLTRFYRSYCPLLKFSFLDFSRQFLRYCPEIWYMNWFRLNTDQVRLSSRLTYFYRSYCSLLKFSFPDFSRQFLRYCPEIWYMNWFRLNTDQVRLSSRLTSFARSNCPLLEFSFPDFSLQSFEILTWNLIYLFVFTLYRSSSTFVAFDILSLQLLPYAKI